jgi:hypothetical protein
MGDMGEIFNAMREHDRERRTRNLENAFAEGTDGWTVHTPIHWSRDLLGDRIDYWPTRNKFRWRRKTRTGNVKGFIDKREREAADDRQDRRGHSADAAPTG